MTKIHVTTTVNGDPADFLADPRETLLDALRDQLGLTGTKEGCGTGDCGACSVIVDGVLVCSCLMLAAEAEGKKVETIEGMAGEELHPLQRQFIEHAALQCGFCTPGILVAAKALLERNPDPTDTEIRYWLAGKSLTRSVTRRVTSRCRPQILSSKTAATCVVLRRATLNATSRHWLHGNTRQTMTSLRALLLRAASFMSAATHLLGTLISGKRYVVVRY